MNHLSFIKHKIDTQISYKILLLLPFLCKGHPCHTELEIHLPSWYNQELRRRETGYQCNDVRYLDTEKSPCHSLEYLKIIEYNLLIRRMVKIYRMIFLCMLMF